MKIEIEYDLTDDQVVDFLMFKPFREEDEEKFFPENLDYFRGLGLIKVGHYSYPNDDNLYYLNLTYSGECVREKLSLGVF